MRLIEGSSCKVNDGDLDVLDVSEQLRPGWCITEPRKKKKAEPKADKEGEMATSRRDIYSRCVFTIFSSNSF